MNLMLAVFENISPSQMASWGAGLAAVGFFGLVVVVGLVVAVVFWLVGWSFRHRAEPAMVAWGRRQAGWAGWLFVGLLFIGPLAVHLVVYQVAIQPARAECAQFWRALTSDDVMEPIPDDALPARNEGNYVDRCVTGEFDD